MTREHILIDEKDVPTLKYYDIFDHTGELVDTHVGRNVHEAIYLCGYEESDSEGMYVVDDDGTQIPVQPIHVEE